MTATCPVTVDRGSGRASYYQPCGRKVLEGHSMCSMHEKVEARRKAKDEARREKMNRGQAIQREAQELSARLGFEVRADYSWSRSDYTGDFVLPAEVVRRLAGEQE